MGDVFENNIVNFNTVIFNISPKGGFMLSPLIQKTSQKLVLSVKSTRLWLEKIKKN